MHESVQTCALFQRFIQRVTHDHERGGQNLHMVARASEFLHAAFYVCVEALAFGERRLRGENSLGGFGGDLPSRFR